jgi:hypothetical protein
MMSPPGPDDTRPQGPQSLQTLIDRSDPRTPDRREDVPGFRFQATGTVEKLFAAAVPEALQTVVSQRAPTWNQLRCWLRELDCMVKNAFLGPIVPTASAYAYQALAAC